MASRKRKEPTVVLVMFLILQVALIVLFAVRGNFRELEERYDWKQLSIICGFLFFIYIMYVELRAKRMGKTLVDEKIKTHTLVDALPQPVMVVDDEDRIVTANDAACRRLSIDSVASVGMDVGKAFDESTADHIRSGGAGIIDGSSSSGAAMRITLAPMKGEAGKLVILEGAAPAPQQSSTAAGPAVWDALLPLDELMDQIKPEARRIIGGAMIRARKSLNRPEDVAAVPAVATKEAADLGAIVREAEEKVGPIARARGITLDVKANGTSAARADRATLRRAVEEILVNACTYSPEGSTVRVEVGGSENEVLLQATDPGVGIPADEIPRIFDLGFVGSNQVPEAEGGRGVGLALARRVVDSHGGSIWVESQVGKGTRISLNIPRT